MLRNAWYGRKEYDGEDNKKDIWEMISSVSYSTHIAGNAGRADQKFLNICRKVLLIMIWIRYMNSLMRMRGEKV